MKKTKFRMVVTAFIMLSCIFTACGKEPIEPNTPIQELLVYYPLDNMLAYTAAEDGTVFAVNLDMAMEEPTYKLHRFDPQGEDKECIPLERTYMVEAMAVSPDGKKVYFTAQRDEGGVNLALYAYGVEDGEITMECALPYFDSVRQIVLIENVIYLLGQSPGWKSADVPDGGYSFAGERLVSYARNTGELTQLGFDFPISMAAGGNQMLVVFGYLDGMGYCVMEYDAIKDSMQVISSLEEYKFEWFAVCNDGRDVVYDYYLNSRGLVLSDITNLSVEAELYPDGITIKMPPFCAGGRVYCDSKNNGGLVSFPLDAVKRNNKELRFITREYGILSSPYGCGYAINREELSDEKFTLKVLARDRDYDLCMGQSLLDGSRNLRENGVFYPLNDVPGVEEYLARCFPYVREAATKENGIIWMLPVEMNVRGFVAKQGALKEAGILMHDGMTWVEYAQILDNASKEDRALMEMSFGFMALIFEHQYFTQYHTLENELFTDNYAALLKLGQMEFGKGIKEDFILTSMGVPTWLEYSGTRQKFGEDAVFFAMPRLMPSDKNFASCTFLAVNPDSARREDALAYIADLVAYLMQQKNLPFFTDWQGEGELDATMHQAYGDAEIVFAVESDAYEEGFWELLSGEISLEEYKEKTEPKLGMYWGE